MNQVGVWEPQKGEEEGRRRHGHVSKLACKPKRGHGGRATVNCGWWHVCGVGWHRFEGRLSKIGHTARVCFLIFFGA